MVHLWVRAEQRPHEERVGLTPEGAAALVAAGITVSVEESHNRAIPIDGYLRAGCQIVAENSWPFAPKDAIIFGLKELPEDGTPLTHRHIMFGHAFKGQPAGKVLLQRFKAGGGVLYDLEYLVNEQGRRVAAFGYWAGYAGAAVSLKCWAAQQRDGIAGPVAVYAGKAELLANLAQELAGLSRPNALIIGFVGWFVPWHRLDQLLSQFATLAPLHPSIHLMLVGDGPLRDSLTTQALQLGIADRLILTGSVPHHEIPHYLAAIDICVVPHSNEYRSPIKLFESMAQGRATIAPRTEPIAQVIEDGVNGLLFDPTQPDQLGEAIEKCLLNPTLRASLGSAATTSIREKHTWDQNAAQVLDGFPWTEKSP